MNNIQAFMPQQTQQFITGLLTTLILSLITLFSQVSQADEFEKIRVQASLHTETLTLNATIEAVNQGTVSAQTTGRITQLNYDVSDFVPAGSTLLEITDTNQAADILAAQADVAASEANNTDANLNLQRLKALYPQGAISKGQLDQAKANAQAALSRLQAAKAHLSQAQQAHSYTQVNAPFTGVVTERHVEIGETVMMGTPLYSGFSLDKLRALASIPQSYLSYITPDTQYDILLNNAQVISSRDAVLFSYADSASHGFKLRINFNNLFNSTLDKPAAQLRPGMWVKIRFAIGETEQIWLPRSAVTKHYQLNAVYLNTAQGWQLTQVRLGQTQGDQVQIISGLRNQDEVALNAQTVMSAQLKQNLASSQ
ncbi:efflux RND transporter periplasmic adaptor subunit [Motilimonas sp. E26]|uniref:efflux RND transporter periplasmic adaptor subunit n=1 Tax=Motilimonas sp. E26 TaxID=2865674 RepID=UPI001E3A60DC|nr:efflux RND transporter periplasmic adaptor subunit [Motilimonas sp. E26]MCE0556318.1 efflux RND transporter periplasmic adaptor subunit [Motilimonas sp. E26]